jgi:ATP-dependent Lhr-like helicase
MRGACCDAGVFRHLLEREADPPHWRDLLRVLHRLEARGEVRGGRFVTSFSGEQFALAEALPLLAACRRDGPTASSLELAAADPLNLAGILTRDDPERRARGQIVILSAGRFQSKGATSSTAGRAALLERRLRPS